MRGCLVVMLGMGALGWSGVACGSDPERRGGDPGRPPPPARSGGGTPSKPARPVPRCPDGASNCRRAGGTVIYVEAVDPDGGGDAHLVLASRQSVTARGLTVVDLEPRVRPASLPRAGDWVGAAGPVFTGSHGQRQIEAVRLRVVKARSGSSAAK